MTAQPHDLVRLAWEAEGGLGMPLDEFRRRFEVWEFSPVTIRGETAGVTIMRGPEIHVSILPQYRGRWVTRRFLNETLGRALRDYGIAVTQIFAENLDARRFVERLGFRPIGNTGNILVYEALS